MVINKLGRFEEGRGKTSSFFWLGKQAVPGQAGFHELTHKGRLANHNKSCKIEKEGLGRGEWNAKEGGGKF